MTARCSAVRYTRRCANRLVYDLSHYSRDAELPNGIEVKIDNVCRPLLSEIARNLGTRTIQGNTAVDLLWTETVDGSVLSLRDENILDSSVLFRMTVNYSGLSKLDRFNLSLISPKYERAVFN